MRALRKAIDINPKAKIAYEMLGDRLQDRGQFEAAIEAFNSALAIDDSSAAAYYGISRCRKLTPEDGPMIRRMEQLLQEPERTEDELRHLNYALAKAHDDLGHCELAMRFYDEANRLAKLQRPEQPERAGAVKWGESKLFRTFNPRLFEKYSHLGSQSERPIFIVGMIRSGTTLTEQIISSHRAVAGGGEIKFWMEDDSIRVLRAAMNGASFELQARKLIEKYDQILARLGAGQVRVTDKMPINYIALGLMHLLYPNAKIIHCRRNPIDTCLSIYMTPLGTGPAFAYDRRDIVDTYREYEMVMKHWREALPPGAMLEVKYEDLVDHSEEKIREIVSFLGLEWDEACLQHERNERNVMTPSRWQARQPVYKTSVEKWRRYERWLGVFAELAPES
jgi:tetratricopeptide (TPR) repeat protein